MIVDKKTLADIMGVSLRTLSEWQKEGMPLTTNTSRGKQNEYETVDVIAWRFANLDKSTTSHSGDDSFGIALTKERARKTKAEADRVELRLAKEKLELIEADKVLQAWTTILSDVKQAVLQFPLRITPLIIGLTDEQKIKAVIDSEAKAVLSSLSRSPNYEQELEELDDEAEADTDTNT